MKSFLITFSVGFILFTALIAAFGSGKGIVQLEGYSEAVAFCGCEIEHVMFSPDEATVRHDQENNITYVINKGHEKDEEVLDLMDLAVHTCGQLGEE